MSGFPTSSRPKTRLHSPSTSGALDSPDAESLRRSFAKYQSQGRKFERAIETVLAGCVKEHRFLPSGRSVFTVVGNLSDEFVDPSRPYCSCSNFFFKVKGQEGEYCYHLLSYKMAAESGSIDRVVFSDEEYGQLVAAVAADVFHVLESSSK